MPSLIKTIILGIDQEKTVEVSEMIIDATRKLFDENQQARISDEGVRNFLNGSLRSTRRKKLLTSKLGIRIPNAMKLKKILDSSDVPSPVSPELTDELFSVENISKEVNSLPSSSSNTPFLLSETMSLLRQKV